MVVASSSSGLGDGIVAAALPLLLAASTNDPVVIAGVTAALRAPWIALSLHAGAIVDRLRLDRLLPAIDAVRAVVLALVTLSVLTDTAVVGVAYAGALVIGTGDAVVAAGLRSAVPRLVASRDLDRTNAAMFMSQSVTEHLAGPALGGVLFATAAALPFGVDAATYVLSAALFWLAAPSAPATDGGLRDLNAAVGEGLRWYVRQHALLRMAAFITLFSATQFALLSILVILSEQRYGATPRVYGLILAAGAVGNLLGGGISTRLAKKVSIRATVTVGGAATAGAYMLMGMTTSPWVAGLCMAAEGVMVGAVNVAALTYRQRLIPDRLLGRASSILRLLAWGAVPPAALLAGVSTGAFGVGATTVGIGFVLLATSVLIGPRLVATTEASEHVR